MTCAREYANEHLQFRPHSTGKERDSESGNDYFGARYYASSMGRWLSPDWSAKVEPVPYAKMDNPQSLNLYAYVGNNPLSRVDRDGHVDVLAQCKGKYPCNVTVTDTVSHYHYDKKKGEVLDYTVKITTKFNLTADSKGNVTVGASSTAEQLAGGRVSLNSSQLDTMASVASTVQSMAVGMGFGPKTTQLMSAVGIAEGGMGSDPNPYKKMEKDPSINPLGYSGNRETMDLLYNVQGALDEFDRAGNSRSFSPVSTYCSYSNCSKPTMSNFRADWTSVSEQVQ